MSEEIKPYRYEAITVSNERTVVAEFQPGALGARSQQYAYYRDRLLSFSEAR
jgi:type I restriction enzyme R subunit